MLGIIIDIGAGDDKLAYQLAKEKLNGAASDIYQFVLGVYCPVL